MSALISSRLHSRLDQDWPGHHLLVHEPLQLDCGIEFGPFTIAYQTYGRLNSDRSNAILVCHALTGDQLLPTPIRSPVSPVGGKRWSDLAWYSTPTFLHYLRQRARRLHGDDRSTRHQPGNG